MYAYFPYTHSEHYHASLLASFLLLNYFLKSHPVDVLPLDLYSHIHPLIPFITIIVHNNNHIQNDNDNNIIQIYTGTVLCLSHTPPKKDISQQKSTQNVCAGDILYPFFHHVVRHRFFNLLIFIYFCLSIFTISFNVL